MRGQSVAKAEQRPAILTVPGLDNSGPGHWQSRWEYELPECRRVELGNWSTPAREQWVDRIDAAIGATPRPTILAAHSLGCLAVAWWSKLKWSNRRADKVLGALLVAPPCVDKLIASERIAGFGPAPREPLPFTSILVASRNDPYASFESCATLAGNWGSLLVDAGPAGHVNEDSRLGRWEAGIRLLERLLEFADQPGRGRDVTAGAR